MVFFFIIQSKTVERELGTVGYAFSFTVKSTLVGGLYLALAFIIGFIFPPAKETMQVNIFPIYLMMITKDSFLNPDRPRNLCLLPV